MIGTYNVCRIAAGLMEQHNTINSTAMTNVIINTAGMGDNGEPEFGRVINAVTANAVIGMSKHMSKDLSPYGIRVISVLPNGFKSSEQNETVEGRRFGSPDEFGFIVQSLILNGYMNSEIIEVDGGLKLRKM